MKRTFIAASAVLAWYLGFYFFKPWAAPLLMPLAPDTDGLKVIFNHAFVFSFPTALICGLWWALLVQLNLMPRPRIFRNPLPALRTATVWGVVVAIATLIIVPVLFGFPLQFHPNGYTIVGNLFSNAWEEIIYRGLLFQAFTAATRSTIAGALVSSAIFAFTHDQYPIGLQIYVGIVSYLLCLVFSKTAHFIAPVWMHNVLDWIVDLFL